MIDREHTLLQKHVFERGALSTFRRVAAIAVAVLAVVAVGASGASASAPTARWSLKGVALKSSTAVSSKGTLKIVDSEISSLEGGGSVTIECAMTGEGTVGSGGAGEATKRTLTGCKVLASTNSVCTTSSSVEKPLAIHLPWRTTLAIAEKEVRETISEDGKGFPGVEMTCKSLGIKGEGNTSVHVTTVTGGVDETFDSHSEGLKNSTAGHVRLEGTQLIENPAGSTLAVQRTGAWLLSSKAVTSPVTVMSKGELFAELTFSGFFGGGSVEIDCTSADEGKLLEGGEGEVTSVTLTGCKAVASTSSLCPAGDAATVTAVDLPWRTSLFATVGVANEGSDTILEDGKGEPGYHVECNQRNLDTTGTGQTTWRVSAVTGGVEALPLYSSGSLEELRWSGSADGGHFGGRELIENPGAGTLTFE